MINKKLILLIIALLALLLLLIGSSSLNFNQNYITVNNANFQIPDGFHVSEDNYSVNITNNVDSILITKNITSNNITKEVNDYVDFKKDSNYTVTLSNLTVGDITVCKAKVNEHNAIHYWFEKNDNVYEIYTKSGGDNSDKLVSDLIKSMK